MTSMRTLLCTLVLAVAWCVTPLSHAQSTPGPRVAEAAAARDAYWRALDANDYPAAYAFFTTGMQEMQTREQFSSHHEQSDHENGGAIERRVMRTTIYDNPPGAREPGLYIAFDFVARYESADRSCGYIILHQARDGEPFRVTRTDQTFLPNDQANGSGQPADEVWAQMATSFCPGWQRSWAIQPPV